MFIRLWRKIEKLNLKMGSKYRLFRIALEIPAALFGLAIWLIVRIWVLKTWDWMFCFIGYPVIFSWLVAILYFGSHDFSDGPRDDL